MLSSTDGLRFAVDRESLLEFLLSSSLCEGELRLAELVWATTATLDTSA